MGISYKKLFLVVGIGFCPFLWPIDSQLSVDAIRLVFIFIATILALVIKPMPSGACALLAIVSLNLCGILSGKQVLSGFSNSVIWLIVCSLGIAKAIGLSGLGKRLAFLFIRSFGKTPIGLAYSLSFTDLILSPGMPSATGRAAGIIMPIIDGVAKLFGTQERHMGGYLVLTAYHTTVITSTMFVTAMAANPLIQELAGSLNIHISWTLWAKAAFVPGMVSLLLIPIVIHMLSPSYVNSMDGVRKLVERQLNELGATTRREKIVAATICLLICLWILGDTLQIPAVMTALIGLNVLVISGALAWDDFIKSHEIWDVFIWFAVVGMMAGKLAEFGVIEWFVNHTSGFVAEVNWKVGLFALLLAYFYSHYFFASSTAHVASMYLPFVITGIQLGAPKMICALGFAFVSNLYGCLTHFGLSPGPVLFGLGFVNTKKWWIVGFLVSILHFTVWGLIGSLWWEFLGLWSV